MALRSFYEDLSKEIKDGFEKTFNDGYLAPELRYNYSQWLEALKSVQEPPQIIEFNANRKLLLKKEKVVFTWVVVGADRLLIDETDVTFNGSFELDQDRDTIYTLTAINVFGLSVTKDLFVEVSKRTPLITSFKSNVAKRINSDPIFLSWEIDGADTLVLQPDNINVTRLKGVEVSPVKDTKYILYAETFFGVISKKELEISVSKIPPEIIHFNVQPIDIIEEIYELHWAVDNYETLSIQPEIGEVNNKNKIIVTQPSLAYTLEARSLFGAISKAKINVLPLFIPEPENSLFNR